METVAVLGGSESKRPLLRWLSRQYRVVLFDQDPQCPLRLESDSFHPYGFEAVDLISDALSGEGRLVAILSYSAHPAALRTTAFLSARFGLSSNHPDLVGTTLDKTLWPQFASNTGFSRPEQCTVAEYLARKGRLHTHDGYVLKRRQDTNGGRDVHHTDLVHDQLTRLPTSEQTQFLLQRHITGNEYSVDVGISHSHIHTWSISRKRTRQVSTGIQTVSLSALDDDRLPASEEAFLLTYLKRLVSNLEIQTSLLSLDVIHSDATFFLIDVGLLLDMKVDLAWQALGHNPYVFLSGALTRPNQVSVHPNQLRGWKLIFEYGEDNFPSSGPTESSMRRANTSRHVRRLASENVEELSPLKLRHTWLVAENSEVK